MDCIEIEYQIFMIDEDGRLKVDEDLRTKYERREDAYKDITDNPELLADYTSYVILEVYSSY